MSGKDQDTSIITLVVGAVAGVAAVAYGIASLFSGSSGKTMKAPGRDSRMFRANFEKNPSGYFRDLRNK
ncbi:unnamed protein product [Linum tenue]|uniref:Uncharacterized protein n=1 Tax=Linum tenue TaxID=586396 RepID=A0AAV0NWP3_9ROSI|nr:unnamed protein product [Linum tenue]